MYKKDVDIGAIIKRLVEERNMTVAEFARRLNPSPKGKNKISRNIVYSIFNRKSIDTSLLHEISKILEYDLLSEYYEKNPTTRQMILIEAEKSKIDKIIEELSKDKSHKIRKLE